MSTQMENRTQISTDRASTPMPLGGFFDSFVRSFETLIAR
jgi:hypothetical protein